MSDKIRVLIVDDSAFMRKMVSDMLNNQLDIEVVDTAKDGAIALSKALELKPDVITLDVEMPVKNGLEALKEIKQSCDSQVIMLSSLTSEGSNITIEALRIGAFDFIQKPSGSISLDIEKVKDELIEKVKYAFAYKSKLQKTKFKTADSPKISDRKPIEVKPIEVKHLDTKPRETKLFMGAIDAVVIGASTGGPRVLYDLVTKLPYDMNVPIFIVQHMPAGFTKAFAERMNKNTQLNVIEAKDGDLVQPNTVYIAPGGYHMYVMKNNIRLDLAPSIHGVRPAVDKLFFSAAETYKGRLVACILTGMGRDGADGIRLIKQFGGYTIAQDEDTSTIYGMPKAAYETGCVDIVLPELKIPQEISRVVKRMWWNGFQKIRSLRFKGIWN